MRDWAVRRLSGFSQGASTSSTMGSATPSAPFGGAPRPLLNGCPVYHTHAHGAPRCDASVAMRSGASASAFLKATWFEPPSTAGEVARAGGIRASAKALRGGMRPWKRPRQPLGLYNGYIQRVYIDARRPNRSPRKCQLIHFEISEADHQHSTTPSRLMLIHCSCCYGTIAAKVFLLVC